MEYNKEYSYSVGRNINSFTTVIQVEFDDDVFVKVAPIKDDAVDSIITDALNSSLINLIDKDNEWTIQLQDVKKCDLNADSKTFFVKRDDGKALALAYKNVNGGNIEITTIGHLKTVVCPFLRRLIDTSKEYGLTHNDLHLGNVMYDKKGSCLRLIDYGRVCIPETPSESTWDKLYNMISGISGPLSNNKWDPFEVDKARSFKEHYWMSDLMTFSMLMFLRLLKTGLVNEQSEFVSKQAFKDVDHLKQMASGFPREIAVLLPGLMIYKILQKEAMCYGNAQIVYGNCVLTRAGGAVLINLVQSDRFQVYSDMIQEALKTSGIYGEQSGGSLNDDLEVPMIFPQSLEEAFTSEEFSDLSVSEPIKFDGLTLAEETGSTELGIQSPMIAVGGGESNFVAPCALVLCTLFMTILMSIK